MFDIENEYKKEIEFSAINGYDRGGEEIKPKSSLNKSLFSFIIVGTISTISYFGYNYLQEENHISPKKAVMGVSITNTSKDSLNREDIEKGLDSIYQEEQKDIEVKKAIEEVKSDFIEAKKASSSPSYNSKDISDELNGMVDMFYTQEAIPVKIGNMVDDFYTEKRSSKESTPNGRYVTVKEGDTLAKISRKFYGNAMQYQKIIDANDRLKKTTTLYIGEQISIPY